MRGWNFTVPRWLANGLLPTFSVTVLCLALAFGGGAQQGFWSDSLIQLGSLPLLAVAVFTNFKALPTWPNVRVALVLLGAVLLLPVLQLVPLPPALWANLPGRADIAQTYATAGMSLPWLPMSLNPAATWRGFVSLLPAVALFLATLSLEERWQRVLIGLVLTAAAINIALGMLQVMGGPDSPLRLYTITNPERGVGLYANANHAAALLYCAAPFAVALGVTRFRREHRARAVVFLVALLLFGTVIGIAATLSRAGAALGALAWVLAVALAWRAGVVSRRWLGTLTLGASLLALLLAFQFGFVGLSNRTQDPDFVGTFRWNILAVTMQAASAYFPLGSGFGTFVQAYQLFEPRSLLMVQFINHVHDDWVELWLEGGLLALFVVAGFVFWFAALTIRIWRSRQLQGSDGVVLAQAGSVAVLLLMMHSAVDYPLRTTSLMALFAISCAFLVNACAPRTPTRSAIGPASDS